MRIEEISIEKLNAAEYNPRKDLQPGDPEWEKLERSIEEFGYIDPIIWNEKTGRVVGGHQRLKVLKHKGKKKVKVSVVDLDNEKEKALNLALNKIEGAWDDQLLAELLFDLKEEDQELTGFDMEEIDDLIDEFDLRDDLLLEEDEFDLQGSLENQKEVYIKDGDLIELGSHRLVCGDSTKEKSYKILMNGEKAGLMITDPPYNVNYEEVLKSHGRFNLSREQSSIENDHMSDESFYSFLYKAFDQIKENIEEGGATYVFHADMQGHVFRQAFIDSGLKFSQILIWAKNSLVMGRNDYHWRHEPIIYGWKEGAAHKWKSDRKQSTVLDDTEVLEDLTKGELINILQELIDESTIIYHDKPHRSDLHPTMKPISLIGYLLTNSSDKGEIVLEPFAGSGSTIVAAEQLKRICYAMELDPIYCQVIIDRYRELFPDQNIKINGKSI